MKKLIYYLSESTYSPTVKKKVVKELYLFIPKTSITMLFLSLLFVYIFKSQIENGTLLAIWFIMINLLSLFRIYDYIDFKKQKYPNTIKYYNKFYIKAIINAILWGIIPPLFMQQVDYHHQLVIIIFLIGFSGGVSGFVLDFRISFPFISLLLLPLLSTLYLMDVGNCLFLQELILLFYILLMLSSKHLNRLFFETFQNEERYHKAEKNLELKEKKLSSLLGQAPIGIFYYNKNLKIINHNELFYKIFGLERDIIGFNLKKLKDKIAVQLMENVLLDKKAEQHMGSYNFSFQEKKLWVELKCSTLLDDKGSVIGGIGILEDKTAEHKSYEKINYISLHDSLTGLPNRRYYKNFMQRLIRSPKNHFSYSLLFYMDLNHFKAINDTFGHSVGDELLLSVANRFKSIKIQNSHLGRLGGDEFILAIPYISKNKIHAKKEAIIIANRIKNLFHTVFEIDGLDLYMTTSIGIVIIEPKTDDINNVIRQADMAMYQTKREGRDNISFYDKKLDIEQQELTSLQHDLNHALLNNELELYYQPIVSISNDKLNAVEALIRWNHPAKGLIMPDRFIPMATESGLINKLGWWVADDVCRQLALWKKENRLNFEYVAININARQLHEVNFSQHMEECILKHNINPSFVKLEVTETTLIDNFTKTQKIIKNLQSRGVECSIDDFGTGYSSLSYLKKLSFKVLKIDRIFTAEILTNPDNQTLIKSIIAIGHQFNYTIIIEGIETQKQREKVMEINDTVSYQGFLCSRPIPAKEFEKNFL
jgi:diguanylate cyclase (GGDEF)-like protein/PAS domain S-box-containing protein